MRGPSFLFLEKEGLPCRPWEPAQMSPPRPRPAPEWLAAGGLSGQGQAAPTSQGEPQIPGRDGEGVSSEGSTATSAVPPRPCPHREARGLGPPEWRSQGAPVKIPDRLSGKHSLPLLCPTDPWKETSQGAPPAQGTPAPPPPGQVGSRFMELSPGCWATWGSGASRC